MRAGPPSRPGMCRVGLALSVKPFGQLADKPIEDKFPWRRRVRVAGGEEPA